MINGEYWLTGDAYSTFADGDVGDYNHAMYAFGSAIGLDEDQLSKLYDAGVEANANGIDFRAAAEAWIKEKLEPDYHELDWTDPNLLMAIREQDTVLDCMKEFVGLFGPDIESHCTDEDVIRSLGMAYLVEAGANEDYLKWYLSDPQGDPRDYAIEHMGWIRVDGDSFQMWTFTDGELSEIRNFDGWPEEDDDDNELKSSSQDVGIEELSTNKHFSVPLRMLFDEQLSATDIVALMENDEAFEKYERANKQYEGEEHEHLSLNPPGRDVRIPKIIYKLIAEFRRFWETKDARHINSGYCDHFAKALESELRRLGIDAQAFEVLAEEGEDDDVPSHAFVEADGRFYDSEVPEGVDRVENLPCFKRWGFVPPKHKIMTLC